MHQVFESSETEAIILVDATNAFNSLNQQTALRNIQHLCPPLSKVLINTYWEDVQLYIDCETMLSQEDLQLNIALAKMQTELITAEICHHVYSGFTIDLLP